MTTELSVMPAQSAKAHQAASSIPRSEAKPSDARARFAIALAVAPLLIVALLAAAIDPAYVPWLMSDISSTADINPWTGAMSSSGALLWLVAATTSLFAWRLLKNGADRDTASFLRWAGIISAYMCIDDFFLLHEAVEYLFGISDKFIHAPLGAAILFFLVSFKEAILKLNYPILGLALLFLAISLVFDTPLVFGASNTTIFLEESFKWLGVVCWVVFFASSAYRLVSQSLRRV